MAPRGRDFTATKTPRASGTHFGTLDDLILTSAARAAVAASRDYLDLAVGGAAALSTFPDEVIAA